MSKVLVDREEIEAARNTLANGGGAVGVLRWAESILAQPAEADGPSFAEVLEQASVIQQLGTKNKRIDELQASLSAVTAERDRLLEELAATNRGMNAKLPRRKFAAVGTGALYAEQNYCYRRGWKEGVAALRAQIRAAAMSAKEA